MTTTSLTFKTGYIQEFYVTVTGRDGVTPTATPYLRLRVFNSPDSSVALATLTVGDGIEATATVGTYLVTISIARMAAIEAGAPDAVCYVIIDDTDTDKPGPSLSATIEKTPGA